MMIIKEKNKNIGTIKLNRPKALNALNLEMIRKIRVALEDFEKDADIRAVVFEGNKNFSAGGDLKEIYKDYLKNEGCTDKTKFFREEFSLNKYIISYPKPILSFWTGVTMGGGIGLSIHSDFIVADETVRWAMPETSLGFVPDVSVGYYLSRLPRNLGLYLGMSGGSMGTRDLVDYGLIDMVIGSSSYEKIKDKLVELSMAYEKDQLIEKLRKETSDLAIEGESLLDKEKIDEYFSLGSAYEINKALNKNKGGDFESKTLERLAISSPLMQEVQFEKYFYGKNITRKETLDLDLKIIGYGIESGHLEEGIRSKMIDKDGDPDWPIKDFGNKEIVRNIFK